MKFFFIGLSISFAFLFSCSENKLKSNSPHSEKILKSDCDRELLSRIIDTSVQLLDNGSKLYWNYCCDSSWLTFENKDHQKQIIYSLPKEVVELTHRLGYTEYQEFSTTFLYTSRLISGCCAPEDHYLYDKNTGRLIANIGKTIFVSDEKELPFILSLSNNKSDSTIHNDYTILKLINLDNRKEFPFKIPKRILKKINLNDDFPEANFEVELKKRNLSVYYQTENEGNKSRKESVVTIDFDKYIN